MKPTTEQVRELAEKAGARFDPHWGISYNVGTATFERFAELAVRWGAEQAQQATPEGFVRVPLVMTQAMEEVTQQEDWQWADLLAAAEAVTEEQYNMVQAQQTTVEEPELPEAVAWKPVVGFEGLYSVSTNGDIVNNKTGKQIAKNSTGAGYIKADLFKDGLRTQTSAHRVVAAAFLGSLEGKEVNHKDGDKTNNKLSNLELVTRQENVLHGYYALGHLVKPVIGTCIKTGEKKRYASLSEVRNDGFKPTHVASCASKIPTHNTHKGWTWEFETATQMHDHFQAGVRAGMARGRTLQALQRGFENVLADPEKHGLDLGGQK